VVRSRWQMFSWCSREFVASVVDGPSEGSLVDAAV
jgi:hypothetical protein